MDFASLMTKEISKAKTPVAPTTPSSVPAATTADPSSEKNKEKNKKYVRRADLEAARIAAYNEEQEKLRKEREERATLKRQIEEDEATRRREREEKKRRLAEESKKRRDAEEEAREIGRRKRLGLPELPPRNEDTPSGADDDEDDLEDDELVSRLRERGEPARLFGESHRARLRRYRRLMQPLQTLKLSQGPIPTTLELLPEAEMKVSRTVPREKEMRRYLFRQLASYFTMVLEEWASALARRDQTVKQSFQGRAAYNAMVQSRENMRPLFRRFEQGDLNDSVLEAIVEIVHCAQERRYVDANDGYLRLSIGKAAWPIGVTMVGIHERSAREKLHQSDKTQAHIMSDEITRKYLQSIKRCLTFAQVRWPPDDPLQLMG
ncbi:Prp18 domain containing protein [Elaphomyces granulatus]